MIRRISKNNDYMDIIDSCPSGVVDDIYKVDYFIAGHPETVIEKTPEKVGRHLEVVISANEVQTLTSNGILTRKAYYSSEDQTYPDGHYDLVFVDSLDVWLGEEETDPPFDPGYLTSASMKTLNGESLVGEGNIDVVSYIPSYYVTESWISSQNFASQTWVENKNYASVTYVQNIISSVESGITTDLSSYATQSWVEAQGYITSNPDLSPYATKSWVESQSYLTSGSITGYATESWVSSNFLSTTALSGYATQSWVNLQGFITIDNVAYYLYEQSYATEDWVSYYISSVLEGDQDPVIRHDDLYDTLELYASISWVEEQGYLTSHQDLTGYATESWVQSQGYLTSHQDLSSYATQSWVESQSYLTSGSIIGYATESWVQSQGYLTSGTLPSDIATQSWVQSQGYLTSVPSGYATQSWVESQGYLTSHQDLSSYATKSWVSSNFFEESKVWTGTREQWNRLTSEEQATYKIALVTA